MLPVQRRHPLSPAVCCFCSMSSRFRRRRRPVADAFQPGLCCFAPRALDSSWIQLGSTYLVDGPGDDMYNARTDGSSAIMTMRLSSSKFI